METTRSMVAGMAFIVVLLVLVYGTVALYQGTFRSFVEVDVTSDRAGLTMAPGAPVKLRGVEVGTVSSIEPIGDGATIRVKIDSDQAKWVRTDARAVIVPPTAFGAKYVDLSSESPTDGAATVRDGDTLEASAVTVEINTAFTRLAEVLDAVRPTEVNNVLTAASAALEGRGNDLGSLIDNLDGYLADFNRELPALQASIDGSADVLGTYEQLAPDLVNVLDNAATTAATLTERRAKLAAIARQLSAVSANGEDLFSANGDAISRLLDVLERPTGVLARYSPMLACTLSGTARNDDLAKEVLGGRKPGLNTYTKLQPSDRPYKVTDQLPQVARDRGPDCFGLPNVSAAEAAVPNPDFGTGSNPYVRREENTSGQPLIDMFFGTLAGLVGQ